MVINKYKCRLRNQKRRRQRPGAVIKYEPILNHSLNIRYKDVMYSWQNLEQIKCTVLIK